MTALRHDHQAQMKSVNRLLEISEMKHYLEEIQTDKPQQLSPYRYRATPIKYKNKQTSNNWSISLQKSQEMKSKQYQHDAFYLQRNNYGDADETQAYNTGQQTKNQRFPQVSRSSAKQDNILSMNSTFHPSSTARYSRNQSDFRYIRGDELSSVFGNKQQKPKNNVVYLKPNRSETIRELLNQMKLERSKHKQVQLNSMIHHGQEHTHNTPVMFSENQLKQLKKYKNFMPFREDQRLLIQKIGERQSVWKRKFKQSWQKRKHQIQTQKQNLKPIPKK